MVIPPEIPLRLRARLGLGALSFLLWALPLWAALHSHHHAPGEREAHEHGDCAVCEFALAPKLDVPLERSTWTVLVQDKALDTDPVWHAPSSCPFDLPNSRGPPRSS